MVVYGVQSQVTPFVGRAEELSRMAALLDDATCRLLTLTGPGGIGKTRLALEYASLAWKDAAREVYFVPLQSLCCPDHIVLAIAEAVGFQFCGAEDTLEQLLQHLETQNALLILDNFEHLLEGVVVISEILNRSPGIIVLITSRERLNLLEEWVFEVSGLSIPPADSQFTLGDYSAAQLFVQSASRVRPDLSPLDEWASIIDICRLVEGMPLGIELAASWIRTLSCREIAAEIRRGLDILTTSARNMPPHHRNMRAVLNYSWDLLSEEERSAFARLSVFQGGFTRHAAHAVADASLSTLEVLIDKSWLRHNPRTQRYDIHELLSQYGEERLQESAEEARRTHTRHCAYYARLLESCWPRLVGSEYKEAVTAIETDLDNMRSSWNWAVRHDRETEFLSALKSLWMFYDSGNRFQEGEQTFAEAASILKAAGKENELCYGQVLTYQGALLYSLDRITESKALLASALEVLRPLDAKEVIAFNLRQIGMAIQFERVNTAEEKEYYRQSLEIYRELNDLWGIAYTLQWLCMSHTYDSYDMESIEIANGLAQESLDAYQKIGCLWGIAAIDNGLSTLANMQGDTIAARRLAEESLRIYQELGVQWGLAVSYAMLSWTALMIDERDEARRLTLDGLKIVQQYRLWRHAQFLLDSVAMLFVYEGKIERTYEVLGMMAHYRQQYGQAFEAGSFASLVPLDESLPSELKDAVTRGKMSDYPAALSKIMDELSQEAPVVYTEPASQAQPTLLDPLSQRELEILRLVALGLSNQQIADEMVIALGTVKTHVHNIYSKLGVESRTQAIASARDLSLI